MTRHRPQTSHKSLGHELDNPQMKYIHEQKLIILPYENESNVTVCT